MPTEEEFLPVTGDAPEGVDTAAEEATYLANICSKVTVLVRKDYMRASMAMQHRVNRTKNIEVLYNKEWL